MLQVGERTWLLTKPVSLVTLRVSVIPIAIPVSPKWDTSLFGGSLNDDQIYRF